MYKEYQFIPKIKRFQFITLLVFLLFIAFIGFLTLVIFRFGVAFEAYLFFALLHFGMALSLNISVYPFRWLARRWNRRNDLPPLEQVIKKDKKGRYAQLFGRFQDHKFWIQPVYLNRIAKSSNMYTELVLELNQVSPLLFSIAIRQDRKLRSSKNRLVTDPRLFTKFFTSQFPTHEYLHPLLKNERFRRSLMEIRANSFDVQLVLESSQLRLRILQAGRDIDYLKTLLEFLVFISDEITKLEKTLDQDALNFFNIARTSLQLVGVGKPNHIIKLLHLVQVFLWLIISGLTFSHSAYPFQKSSCGWIQRNYQDSACMSFLNPSFSGINEGFFLENSSQYYGAVGDSIYIFDVTDSTLEKIFTPRLHKFPERIDTWAISPSRQYLAVCAEDVFSDAAAVYLYELSTGEEKFLAEINRCYYGDGFLVSDDGLVVADLIGANAVIEPNGTVTNIDDDQIDGYFEIQHFTPDGLFLVNGDADQIYLMSLPDLERKRKLSIDQSCCYDALFTADGTKLINLDLHYHLIIWDLEYDQLDFEIQLERDYFDVHNCRFAVNRDFTKIATCFEIKNSDTYGAQVWSLESGQLLQEIIFGDDYDFRPFALSFSPDGSILMAGTNDYMLFFDLTK